MRKLIETTRDLVQDDEGATLVEYAILVALLSAVAIGIIITLGEEIVAMYSGLQGAF